MSNQMNRIRSCKRSNSKRVIQTRQFQADCLNCRQNVDKAHPGGGLLQHCRQLSILFIDSIIAVSLAVVQLPLELSPAVLGSSGLGICRLRLLLQRREGLFQRQYSRFLQSRHTSIPGAPSTLRGLVPTTRQPIFNLAQQALVNSSCGCQKQSHWSFGTTRREILCTQDRHGAVLRENLAVCARSVPKSEKRS